MAQVSGCGPPGAGRAHAPHLRLAIGNRRNAASAATALGPSDVHPSAPSEPQLSRPE